MLARSQCWKVVVVVEEWVVDGILLLAVLMIGSGDFDAWEAGKRKDS